MEARLRLPNEVGSHWVKVLDVLSRDKWSPISLISAIDEIRKSSYKQVKEMPPESRFSGLYRFFKDANYVGGSPHLFWGDKEFINHDPASYIKGWFLAHTVPFMTQLVRDIPETFPSGVLSLNTLDQSIQERSFSKVQCASLLACAFFSAFHHTAAPRKKSVNFDGLFIALNHKCPQNLAKLCMLMNYFERCRLKLYQESLPVIIYRLHNLAPSSINDWVANSSSLTEFTVNSSGSINDASHDTLHADFANRWIGGGVLNRGAVQEEIMFSICPELLTTIHLCDVMNDNEAIVISGAEEYSLHTGYSKDLKFVGNASKGDGGAVSRVAMDATRFRGDSNHMRQYSEAVILRELNKAYVAFHHEHPAPGAPIATGNWGCGAYGGHIQLKSMLQWVAASACSRPVIYYTFNDPNCAGLEEMTKFLKEKHLTAGRLFEEVKAFAAQIEPNDTPKNELFQHLRATFQD